MRSATPKNNASPSQNRWKRSPKQFSIYGLLTVTTAAALFFMTWRVANWDAWLVLFFAGLGCIFVGGSAVVAEMTLSGRQWLFRLVSA